jgi:hypothetical protein
MPPIQTIASPRRDRISVAIPKEYRSYSFQVILVPLAPESSVSPRRRSRLRKRETFVDALLSCPRFGEGEDLDISRDRSDCGREISL